MPASLDALYTVDAGPGFTSPQAFPADSIGGFASSTPYPGGVVGDLFGMASTIDVAGGRPDYRCLYVYNPSYTTALADVRVFVEPATAGGAGLVVGVDPRPVTYVDSTAAQAVEPGSAYTPPAGVLFSAPDNYADGVQLGNLPPRAGRPVWLRRTPVYPAPGAPEAADVTVTDGGANAIVRRVTWLVEPAGAVTAPFRTRQYVPTPTPFTRVAVDFATTGGSRVTWEVDRTLIDGGPYDYQLQCSQVGSAAADDWVNVGAPVRDATYLLDPDRRLWGASSTLHYRVILTTATGAYASPAAHVYGTLDREQWLTVREVFRKEQLLLRRFTGWKGFLLKAKRYGPVCTTCTDPVSFEVGNSSCPVCYGQGVAGGYHPPVPFAFADVGNDSFREKVAYNEDLGTIADAIVVKGRALALLPVVHRDAWVFAGSDRRYHVWKVTVAAARLGVPIVLDVELRMAMRSDVLYNFPIDRPPDDPPYWEVEQHVMV